MKNLLFLFVLLLFSCEKDYYPTALDCKECRTIITENDIVVQKSVNFVCGEELCKQEKANFVEVNDYTKITTITKTTCIKGNIKTK